MGCGLACILHGNCVGVPWDYFVFAGSKFTVSEQRSFTVVRTHAKSHSVTGFESSLWLGEKHGEKIGRFSCTLLPFILLIHGSVLPLIASRCKMD